MDNNKIIILVVSAVVILLAVVFRRNVKATVFGWFNIDTRDGQHSEIKARGEGHDISQNNSNKSGKSIIDVDGKDITIRQGQGK